MVKNLPFLRKWQEFCMAPANASSLAIFRIMFGFILGWYAFDNLSGNSILLKYIEPKFLFTFPLFDALHLKRLPAHYMYTLFKIMGISACMIGFGIFYRASLLTFFLSFGYMFLLEKSEYNNHYYLILLIAFLLFFMGTHRCWSMDALRNPKLNTRTVPFWNIFILRAQICIVYFYAGLTKINKDFLDGKQIHFWLSGSEASPAIKSFLNSEFMMQMLIHTGILFDLSIGFLLCNKATRLFGFSLALIFHLMNHWFFNFYIGIFPYFMIASLILFVDPDEPEILFDKIRRLIKLPSKTSPSVRQNDSHPSKKLETAVLIFVITYLFIQVFLPLQHHLYPSNVNWTREGHRYCWRLKSNVTSGILTMVMINPETNEITPIMSFEYINPMQYFTLQDNPDMLIQYAHFLRENSNEVKKCN